MVTYKRQVSVIEPGVKYSDYKIDNYYIIYIFYSAPGYINILYDDCIAFFGEDILGDINASTAKRLSL